MNISDQSGAFCIKVSLICIIAGLLLFYCQRWSTSPMIPQDPPPDSPTSQNSHTALLKLSMQQNLLPNTLGKTAGLPSTDLLFVYPWSLHISHMIHQCSLHLTSPHCRSLSIILWWPMESIPRWMLAFKEPQLELTVQVFLFDMLVRSI